MQAHCLCLIIQSSIPCTTVRSMEQVKNAIGLHIKIFLQALQPYVSQHTSPIDILSALKNRDSDRIISHRMRNAPIEVPDSITHSHSTRPILHGSAFSFVSLSLFRTPLPFSPRREQCLLPMPHSQRATWGEDAFLRPPDASRFHCIMQARQSPAGKPRFKLPLIHPSSKWMSHRSCQPMWTR